MLTCPKCGEKFQEDQEDPVEWRGLKIKHARVLVHTGGTHQLPEQERLMLELLIMAEGETVKRRTIDWRFYASHPERELPSRNHVAQIRRRLDAKLVGSGFRIANQRSVGYYLTDAEKAG